MIRLLLYLVADYHTSSWLVPNLSPTFMSLVDLPWDHGKNKVSIAGKYLNNFNCKF